MKPTVTITPYTEPPITRGPLDAVYGGIVFLLFALLVAGAVRNFYRRARQLEREEKGLKAEIRYHENRKTQTAKIR